MGLYSILGLWANGIIQYKNQFPKKDLILKRMKYYEDNSSVTFKDVSNDSSIDRYIIIGDFGGIGGIEIPGRATGEVKLDIKNIADEQKLSRVITHEIGHMVGLYHMHQAANRDKFIKVNKQNLVNKNKEEQYTKVLRGVHFKIVGDYDFESITHYPPFEENGNGKKVIEILDPNNNEKYFNKMGTEDRLSDIDIKTLKQMYK